MRPDPRPNSLRAFRVSDGLAYHVVTSDYHMKDGDGTVYADTSAGPVAIWLPPVGAVHSLVNKIKHVRVGAFSSQFSHNPLTIRIAGDAEFLRGGTSRVIHDTFVTLDFFGGYIGWASMTPHHAGVQVCRTAAWAAAQFAAATAIPFDNLDYASNESVVSWDNAQPERVTINVPAHAHISGWGRIDSQAGGDYSVRVQAYLNGVALASIDTAASGWAGRDSGFAFGPGLIDCVAGDYLELRLHHTNLTGGLAAACFVVSLNM